MDVNVPEPDVVFGAIANVRNKDGGNTRSISEWRKWYREELAKAKQAPPVRIFIRFANSLLERAMPGESWHRRMKGFHATFRSFEDITEQSVANVLGQTGYRFPSAGLKVIMEAKLIATADGFSWRRYIQRAEQSHETDFQDDEFLGIPGVGYKTRDLGLSELSDRFAAMDLHIVRVTTRTGLLVHGYGSPQITTDVSSESGYLFFHDLILSLAKRTGWPQNGFSPGEIDRMLWHFGRAMCKAEPSCQGCPLTEICLTFQGRSR